MVCLSSQSGFRFPHHLAYFCLLWTPFTVFTVAVQRHLFLLFRPFVFHACLGRLTFITPIFSRSCRCGFVDPSQPPTSLVWLERSSLPLSLPFLLSSANLSSVRAVLFACCVTAFSSFISCERVSFLRMPPLFLLRGAASRLHDTDRLLVFRGLCALVF